MESLGPILAPFVVAMADEDLTPPTINGTDDKDSWLFSVLRQPLSRVQAVVGITAGLLSVFGVVFPLLGSVAVPTHGDFVGIVRQARTGKPVLYATVEITTPQEVVVTTLTSVEGGRVHHRLKEGQYRLRVNHPKFTPEIRQVMVMAGQTSEVHLTLQQRPAPPPPAKPVEKQGGAVSRFFRSLGL